MIARVIPFAGIASWNAFASSGGIGFVFRSIRGLREKIWIASAPTALPRSGASAMLSTIETWAPRYIAPPRGNRLNTDELADVRVGLRWSMRIALCLAQLFRAGRMPDDLRRHAEVTDDRIDRVAGEFMVRRLVDVAEDEFDVRNIPNARVRPRMHELCAVEVHADHASAGRRGDECEPPFARADVQDELSAKVLMPELIQQQGTK